MPNSVQCPLQAPVPVKLQCRSLGFVADFGADSGAPVAGLALGADSGCESDYRLCISWCAFGGASVAASGVAFGSLVWIFAGADFVRSLVDSGAPGVEGADLGDVDVAVLSFVEDGPGDDGFGADFGAGSGTPGASLAFVWMLVRFRLQASEFLVYVRGCWFDCARRGFRCRSHRCRSPRCFGVGSGSGFVCGYAFELRSFWRRRCRSRRRRQWGLLGSVIFVSGYYPLCGCCTTRFR